MSKTCEPRTLIKTKSPGNNQQTLKARGIEIRKVQFFIMHFHDNFFICINFYYFSSIFIIFAACHGPFQGSSTIQER